MRLGAQVWTITYSQKLFIGRVDRELSKVTKNLAAHIYQEKEETKLNDNGIL